MFASLRERSNRGEYVGRTIESMILTGTQDSSRRESRLASSNSDQKEAKPIEIDGAGIIWSVAFLADGKHAVSGGTEEKIRRWRVEDGKEVGIPMDAGSPVYNIAVSQDGKWVVGGTASGLVTVWNAESYSKVTEWKAHDGGVCAVDVSPDGTRIASGSRDCSVCVWSLSTGERLLDPLQHDKTVVAVKFSPNGRLVATATWDRDVRVYDSRSATRLRISPSPGPATASNCLPYLAMATSTISTCPPSRRSPTGPFTPVTMQGASHWEATARTSQSALIHRPRSGTLRRTSESGLSSSTLMTLGPWLSQQTTTS
jgi:WD40 repeat protein